MVLIEVMLFGIRATEIFRFLVRVTTPQVLVEPFQVIRRVKMKDDLTALTPPFDFHASLPPFFKLLFCSLYVGVFRGGSGLWWVEA